MDKFVEGILWEMGGPRFSLGLECEQHPRGLVATNSHRKED